MTIKTHSGAKKRFSFTGSGKARFKPANLRHGMRKRPSSMKRNATRSVVMINGDRKRVEKMLPHGL
jgi:large subunit ribosomal protein L35